MAVVRCSVNKRIAKVPLAPTWLAPTWSDKSGQRTYALVQFRNALKSGTSSEVPIATGAVLTNTKADTGDASTLSGDLRERVTQVHRDCLNSVYATDYFKELSRRQFRYSKHFDFAIGLGSTVSGGSGLGILGNPNFAWLCGILTALSFVLTVAKSAYDWPSKLKETSNMIENYGRLSGKYSVLVDDLNYRKIWSDAFEDRYKKLKDEETSFSAVFPDLPEDAQRSLQNGIKKRIDYKTWWKPSDGPQTPTGPVS